MKKPPESLPSKWPPKQPENRSSVRLLLSAGFLAVLGSLLLAAPFFAAPSHDSSTPDDETDLRTLQQAENCTLECCLSIKDEVCEEEDSSDWVASLPNAVQFLLIFILVSLSALFSGLTLGLMGLDKTGLQIIMESDNPANAKAAARIFPVRENGNLLLCTLLLGNVAVNALLSIVLAEKAGGTLGFLVSTFLIVIFGEIVPQATCSRYALEIGSRTVPIVKLFIVLLYVIAKPLSMGLDYALGEELATTYSSSEMRKLLQIHVQENVLDVETGKTMQGALEYQSRKVCEVMTPLAHTFMINVEERLNFEMIATIFKTGYSRIPVYEVSKNNIIGLLFVKDLIFIDPEDETPARNFVQIFGRGVHVVWPDDTLGDVLKELKQGRSHMAVVRDVCNTEDDADPYYEVKGIITLEDIIEEILGDEIVDETDAFVDGTHSTRVDRREEDFDWGRLRLLDAKIVDETLSREECKAVVAHLRTNYAETVSLLSEHQLRRLVAETPVTELPTAPQEVGTEVVPEDCMYYKGVATDTCTLILSGKVTVLAGVDQFRSDLSSWSVLGSHALTEVSFAPDYTAFVSGGPCRCLRLTRDRYTAAVDASALERTSMHGGTVNALSTEHEETLTKTPSPGRFERNLSEDFADKTAKAKPKKARRNQLIEALQRANSKRGDLSDATERKQSDPTSLEASAPLSSSKVGFMTSATSNEGLSGATVSTSTRSVRQENATSPPNGSDMTETPANSSRTETFEYIDSSRGVHMKNLGDE